MSDTMPERVQAYVQNGVVTLTEPRGDHRGVVLVPEQKLLDAERERDDWKRISDGHFERAERAEAKNHDDAVALADKIDDARDQALLQIDAQYRALRAERDALQSDLKAPLRRLVDYDNALCIGDDVIKCIAEDARALLAEPEGEEPTLRSMAGAAPDLTGGVESVEWLRRKRAAMEDNYAAYATPRSRAEAEAMVGQYRITCREMQNAHGARFDAMAEEERRLRAALLAALTTEGK